MVKESAELQPHKDDLFPLDESELQSKRLNIKGVKTILQRHRRTRPNEVRWPTLRPTAVLEYHCRESRITCLKEGRRKQPGLYGGPLSKDIGVVVGSLLQCGRRELYLSKA